MNLKLQPDSLFNGLSDEIWKQILWIRIIDHFRHFHALFYRFFAGCIEINLFIENRILKWLFLIYLIFGFQGIKETKI